MASPKASQPAAKKLGGSTRERNSDFFFTVPAYNQFSNNLFIKSPVRYTKGFYTHAHTENNTLE